MDSRILGFTCVIIAAVLFGSIYSLAKLPLADIDPILASTELGLSESMLQYEPGKLCYVGP